MERLRRRLPPLSSLLAFEAAGRHGNFTAAGRELNVTQAAISRQIQVLEGFLGLPVFLRRHRAVRLTPEGERLHQAVTMSLEHIARLAGDLRQSAARQAITLGATIGFATFWLMPLLNRFRAEEPGLDLRLMASDSVIDLEADGVDLAVRYGSGHWPPLEASHLFGDEIFPVCSPDFRQAHPVAAAADLTGLPLLALEAVDPSWMTWETWLKAAGVAAPPAPRRLVYNNYPLLVQAAVDGQGVALGWRHFVDPLLAEGRLVRLLDLSVVTDFGFYLVAPEGGPRRAEARRLRSWLLAQAAPLRQASPAGGRILRLRGRPERG